jgi:hypothetical protein
MFFERKRERQKNRKTDRHIEGRVLRFYGRWVDPSGITKDVRTLEIRLALICKTKREGERDRGRKREREREREKERERERERERGRILSVVG